MARRKRDIRICREHFVSALNLQPYGVHDDGFENRVISVFALGCRNPF